MTDDYVCVLQTTFPPHADIVAGALKATGIAAQVFASQLGHQGGQESRVMVPAEQAEEAREVIATLESETEE